MTAIDMKLEGDMWASLAGTFSTAVLPPPAAEKGDRSAAAGQEAGEEKNYRSTIPKVMVKARSLVCVPDRWMQSSKKHQYEAGLAAVTKSIQKGMPSALPAPTAGGGRKTPSKLDATNVDCPSVFLPALVKSASELKTTIAENPQLKALMTALVRKAFFDGEKKGNEIKTFKVEDAKYKHNGNQDYCNLLNAMFNLPRRSKEVLAVGFYVMYRLCTEDEVGSTLMRIGDHMNVCVPGQQQGVDYLFALAGLKLDVALDGAKRPAPLGVATVAPGTTRPSSPPLEAKKKKATPKSTTPAAVAPKKKDFKPAPPPLIPVRQKKQQGIHSAQKKPAFASGGGGRRGAAWNHHDVYSLRDFVKRAPAKKEVALGRAIGKEDDKEKKEEPHVKEEEEEKKKAEAVAEEEEEKVPAEVPDAEDTSSSAAAVDDTAKSDEATEDLEAKEEKLTPVPAAVVVVEKPQKEKRTLVELQRKFETYFQEYLDDHKERALYSAVFEPAKYVLTASGASHEASNFDVHGQNWYLVAMIESLGEAAFPVLAVEDDYAQQSTTHPYGNLTPDAVRAFQEPLNFGKGWAGIKELKDNKGYRSMNKVTKKDGSHRFGAYPKPLDMRPLFVTERRNAAENPKEDESRDPPADIKAWATMAEHLAFFFTQDFFVPKCFETLNGETKPEYLGFRQCCVDLFQHYKGTEQFQNLPARPRSDDDDDEEDAESELDEDGEFYAHFYEDEYYTKLDKEKVTHFFEWLGVVKAWGTYTPKYEASTYLQEFELAGVEALDAVAKLEVAAWCMLMHQNDQGVCAAHQAQKQREQQAEHEAKIAKRKVDGQAKVARREAKRNEAKEESDDEECPQLFATSSDIASAEDQNQKVATPLAAGGGDHLLLEEEAKMERMHSDCAQSPTTDLASGMWEEQRTNSFEAGAERVG